MSNLQRKKSHHGRKYLWDIQEVLDKWTNEIIDLDNSWLTSKDTLSTKCEITEDDRNYYYMLHVPGIKKEEIKIEIIEDQILRVSGKREEKKENVRKHYSEVSYGFFSREFTLPKAVEKEAIKASEKNGEYIITVPKSLHNKARQIEIE